jgi:GntR family transcriptional regulator, transcriptional repressor for pyruvate dehydrogenase complex
VRVQWSEAAVFQPRRRGSVAQEITDHLRRRIVSGDLRPDARLPPIGELARLYGVSAPTMHASIHGAVALGLLRAEHGVGVFVSRPRSAAALLNHAWMRATPSELALLRASIDTHVPPLVALIVRKAEVRRPRAVDDLVFLADEREGRRIGYPEAFVAADLSFHRAVATCLRGAEMTVHLYETLGHRLRPTLLAVSGVQAADAALDEAHRALALAIADGEPVAAARLARSIARRELTSLGRALG